MTDRLPARPSWAATASLLSLVGLSLVTGCTSDPVLVGRIGISVDTGGDPALVLAGCTGKVDVVDLDLLPVGHDTGSGSVGSWRTGQPVHGLVRLNLTRPGPRWRSSGVTLSPRHHYIAEPRSTVVPAEALGSVTFRASQLRALKPGFVYLNSANPDSAQLVPHPVGSFLAWACAHLGR